MDWVDIGYDKKDLKGFTGRRLKTCYHFSLPTIENFRVSYYGGEYLDHGYWTTDYWGGEFILLKLDNQTIIQCNIPKKVGDDLYGNKKFQQDISGSCHKKEYRIVASTNTCCYSENQLFVQWSQYIRTENPLHKQSEKAKTCH